MSNAKHTPGPEWTNDPVFVAVEQGLREKTLSHADAIDALESVGMSRKEARAAIAKATGGA